MFAFLKNNPAKRLTKKYEALMKEARDIQRSGDLKLYAVKISEAEALAEEIETLRSR